MACGLNFWYYLLTSQFLGSINHWLSTKPIQIGLSAEDSSSNALPRPPIRNRHQEFTGLEDSHFWGRLLKEHKNATEAKL